MTTSQEFRAMARTALTGKWGTAVGVSLVASLLGGSLLSSSGASGGAEVSQTNAPGFWQGLYATAIGRAVMIAMGTLAVVIALYALVCFFIGGAIELGQDLYYLTIVQGGQGAFGQLFGCFDRFGKALAMRLVRSLVVAIGFMLFIVPGILLQYGFAMAGYILAEDPNCGPIEALRRSNDMMRGNRWRLFCLEFSFIGWALLAGLTCGIGVLWLNPYIYAAQAAFYLEVSGRTWAWEEPPQADPEDPYHTEEPYQGGDAL